MIKKIIIISLLSISIVIPNAWAQVAVVNDQQYLDEDDIFHIVGEIENNSSVPLDQIVVSATLYSEDGEVLGKMNTNSILETIMPGKKGPFDLIFFDSTASQIYRYSLDIRYKPTDSKTESLEILSSNARRDIVDNFIISGTVVNHDERTANTVVVIATLYDKDGKVVATGRAYTEPEYLKSGSVAPFLVSITDKAQSRKARDYSLTVESEEYTAVPEFPLGSGIMLLTSVAAYLMLTKKPEIVIAALSRAANSK